MRSKAILAPLLAVWVGAQSPAPPPVQAPPKTDSSPRPGVGDLLVAPQRLILESGHRSEELLLLNTGPRTATYRATFIQMVMAEDGALKELPEKRADGKYADEILRYSPRQVTLEPGISQTIRISVRKPEGLPPGEYRSHLLFRAVPETEPVAKGEEQAKAPGITVQLTPIYGVAIPIIVRHGTTAGTVNWESAKVLPGPSPVLEAYLARTGNRSVYGNLKVLFTPDGGSSPVQVAAMSMAAVYDGLPRRRFDLALNLPGGQEAKGSLRLVFSDPDTDRVLSEIQLKLR